MKLVFKTVSQEMLQEQMTVHSKFILTCKICISITWEDDIRVDLREIGWERVDYIHLTQKYQWRDPVNMAMNFRVP
jgi:hypothetical protein